MRKAPGQEQGFTLIELLIVVIIIGILAAIAIPVYAAQRDKARQASLSDSSHVVAIELTTCRTDGNLSFTYLASGGAPTSTTYKTRAKTNLSNALEAALENGVQDSNGDGIANPFSRKKAIINTAAVPTSTTAQPAVWITGQTATGTYCYSRFPTNATTKARLAGTVVTCFNSGTGNVEVFFVDRNGKKSAACTYLKM